MAAAPFVARAPREGDAADRLIVAVESSRREGYSLVKMDGHVARIYLDVADAGVSFLLTLLFPLRSAALRPEEAGLKQSSCLKPEADLAAPCGG